MSGPRNLDAWALPSGLAGPSGVTASYRDGDVTVRYPAPDPDWLDGLARHVRAGAERVRARPWADVVASLGDVGARFADGADPLRAEALALLPATAGLSPPMAALVLDGMAHDWTGERLTALVRAELEDPGALDGFVASRGGSGRRVRVFGPATCVQIVAGSVPGVGVSALVRSLLVKAPTLLKPGRGDVVLPTLFARALAERDPDLAEALAVVYWPGGSGLDAVAACAADVLVCYGSDETVRTLRDAAPVTTRVVAYHHRTSLGAVGREALTSDAVGRTTAGDVARAAATFDQRGCVSPHVVWVEEGGALTPDAFAELLADEFDQLEAALPGGELERAQAAELHQLRGSAELLRASGRGVRVRHGGAASWSVVFDPNGEIGGTCGGRFVTVRPIADLGALADRLRPHAAHLQTVGVAGAGTRLEALAEAWTGVGASRVVPFEAVAFPPPWWHHDGGGPLRDLLRWTDLGS